jgi:hypothetical protein
MPCFKPTKRCPVFSPIVPLMDGFGPLLGESGPLFVRTGDRLVTI